MGKSRKKKKKNCFRKYVFFARRMLLLRIALYVDRCLRRMSYCVELVFVTLTCLYRLSLYLIDLMMPLCYPIISFMFVLFEFHDFYCH